MEVAVHKITCCDCGILFWITESRNSDLLKTKNSFYCPNGHGQSYTGETCEEKYKKKLIAEEERYKKMSLKMIDKSVESEKRRKSIIGYKGMLGRYKKRLNNALATDSVTEDKS